MVDIRSSPSGTLKNSLSIFRPATFRLEAPDPGESQRFIVSAGAYNPGSFYLLNPLNGRRTNFIPSEPGDYQISCFGTLQKSDIDPGVAYQTYLSIEHWRDSNLIEQWQINDNAPVGSDPAYQFGLSLPGIIIYDFKPLTDVILFNSNANFDVFAGGMSVLKVG